MKKKDLNKIKEDGETRKKMRIARRWVGLGQWSGGKRLWSVLILI